MKKKPLGLKYSTMNNHFVKGQRVPSKKYKENYDKIRWEPVDIGSTEGPPVFVKTDQKDCK